MPIVRQTPDSLMFNRDAELPFMLRLEDFGLVMQDIYDFFFDANTYLSDRRLKRLDDMLRPAAMSGLISDMITASMARHSRVLVENRYHKRHPDLVVNGIYPNDAVKAGEEGVEVKSTRKAGGAVDTHGAQEQWRCVFVYKVDNETEPAAGRAPMRFTEIYLGHVTVEDFRRNPRSELGTPTATLDRLGIKEVRIHDLRHSFASRTLALGESLPMIARLLGYREIETTARYAHLDRASIHEAATWIAEDTL